MVDERRGAISRFWIPDFRVEIRKAVFGETCGFLRGRVSDASRHVREST